MGSGQGKGRGSGGGKGRGRGRAPRTYDVHNADSFVLQPLSELHFGLDSNVVADLAVAEGAVWDLNQRIPKDSMEAYAQAMLTIEAIASVRMDGRPPSARDIFFELVETELRGEEPSDHIVRYKRDRASLEYALSRADGGASVKLFRDVHERVLPPKHSSGGGVLREGMEQVGGSRYHVFGSAYTMPLPEDVEDLLDDLASFLNEDSIPAIEQAGIAHAQLINIHPFDRGNGKMARMMIHHTLRYRGIAPYLLLPFTCIITTSSHDYIAGIDGCKFTGEEGPDRVSEAMNAWLGYFSQSCLKASRISAEFVTECDRVVFRCREVAKLRRGSAASAIVSLLPALPVFTAKTVEQTLGCSFKRASEACKLLHDAGAIELVGNAKRNRVYYCSEILDAYMRIEALK